jgi:hypothetical protein
MSRTRRGCKRLLAPHDPEAGAPGGGAVAGGVHGRDRGPIAARAKRAATETAAERMAVPSPLRRAGERSHAQVADAAPHAEQASTRPAAATADTTADRPALDRRFARGGLGQRVAEATAHLGTPAQGHERSAPRGDAEARTLHGEAPDRRSHRVSRDVGATNTGRRHVLDAQQIGARPPSCALAQLTKARTLLT